ncbi:E3 ubiquitin-protein ligase Zswim2-like [Watersipora subatra]|uniref:E3 ubiquitin-protein ligase Zswim2-like n=1 Tax=Watersipora subatra TaxID=2589382 RepID=UPI00355C052B
MARSVNWKRQASDTTSWRQDQALNSTAFIVSEIGPLGFVLKVSDENKPVKVMLGDPHSCTCSGFRSERTELCKHICWVLLKKFRVTRDDPISWQSGLVEREINSLLLAEKKRRSEIRNRPVTPRQLATAPKTHNGRTVLEQREITEEDSCPICMEDLLANRQPVTYCRYSCSNNIHIKCMKIWAEHQSKSGDIIRCPFCREDFGPIEHLREEYRNTAVDSGGIRRHTTAEHGGTTCEVCGQRPITGKCYRCVPCRTYTLCQRCFNTPNHTQHSFEFRAVPTSRWRPAQRVITNGLPIAPAVVQNLANREIGDGDYDLLLQLDNPNGTELSEIPEAVIKKLPIERVRVGSRYLARGEQCRLCLRAYYLEDVIRRLPCRHKFHRGCVDDWLLHQHPTCPACGAAVWDGLADSTETNNTRPRLRPRRTANSQDSATVPPEPALEIPGFGIGRRDAHSATTSATQPSPIRSGGRTSSTLSEPALRLERNGSLEDSVTLAQLLLTEAIASNESQTRADDNIDQHSYILSQIAHSRPPSAQNLHARVGNGETESTADRQASDQLSYGNRLVLNTQEEARNSRTRQNQNSYSDTENRKRRSRNMALAASHRQAVQKAKETSSAPSINASQPADAASLYLGSFGNNVQRFTEQPQGKKRVSFQRPSATTGQQEQSTARGNGSLFIGSGPRFTSLENRTRANRPKKGGRMQKQPSPNFSPSSLELTGIALDS